MLPTHLSYDASWPVRKVPLRCTPHFVTYHLESKTYAVVTSSSETTDKVSSARHLWHAEPLTQLRTVAGVEVQRRRQGAGDGGAGRAALPLAEQGLLLPAAVLAGVVGADPGRRRRAQRLGAMHRHEAPLPQLGGAALGAARIHRAQVMRTRCHIVICSTTPKFFSELVDWTSGEIIVAFLGRDYFACSRICSMNLSSRKY